MQPHTLFGDFVAAIEGKLKDPVTVKETFALTYACLLARESADLHKTLYFKKNETK